MVTGVGVGATTVRTTRDIAAHRYPAAAISAAPHATAIRWAVTIVAADGPAAFPWWWPTVPSRRWPSSWPAAINASCTRNRSAQEIVAESAPITTASSDELGRRGAGRGSAACSGMRGGGQRNGQRAGSQTPQWNRG